MNASLIIFRSVDLIARALQLFSYLIVATALLSWFVRIDNPLYVAARRLTEPVVAPFRRISSRIAMGSGMRLDFAPLFALFAIQIFVRLLYYLASLII